MLFRRNVSVYVQSLEGLYFYRVSSRPATHDGRASPLAGEQGTRPDGGEDVTPDADGELRTTGAGVKPGVADPDAWPSPGEVQGGAEPVRAAAEPGSAAEESGSGAEDASADPARAVADPTTAGDGGAAATADAASRPGTAASRPGTAASRPGTAASRLAGRQRIRAASRHPRGRHPGARRPRRPARLPSGRRFVPLGTGRRRRRARRSPSCGSRGAR